jgi:hypothetical protein
MTATKLYEYISKNKESLRSLGICFNTISIDSYNENGLYYEFKIFGDSYQVGYVYLTEDEEDWAQAECYESQICYKNDEWISPEIIFDIFRKL